MTETETLVATRDSHNVQRTISRVWTDAGVALDTAINDRSLDGRHSWSERFGQVTHSESEILLGPDNKPYGAWTVTTAQPDDSYSKQTYTNGRLEKTEHFDSNTSLLASTSYTYDNHGRQWTMEDSRTGTTTLAYYDNDALESTTAPDPSGSLGALVARYEYDSMGRRTEVIHPDDSSTHTVYNAKGQVEKTYGSLQNPVEYAYDYAGRQKTMTTWQDFDYDEVAGTGVGSGGSAVTTWIYDSQRGWLDRKEYADGNGTNYTYTPGGRLASRTWARDIDPVTAGQQDLITLYAYNYAGDLLAVDYLDAGATPDVLYSYTRTGQKDEVVDGQFPVSEFTAGQFLTSAPTLSTTGYTYDYDYNDRLQVELETVKNLLTSDVVLTRTYEDGSETNGLLGRTEGYDLSITGGTSSVSSATYGYDIAGRLWKISDGSDEFKYEYLDDTRNLLETITGPVHTTTYTYESGRNAMTGVDNRLTGASNPVSKYTYTYNELGQRADREQSGDSFNQTTKDTFSYDYLGQVIASSNDTETGYGYNPIYGFDPTATNDPEDPQHVGFDTIGNRQKETRDVTGTKAYVADALNQYDSVGGVTYTYDSDGNLTDDGIWTYTWNGENRLINADNGTITIDFEYDYQGRLVKKDDGTNVEVYLYDGWNRIATFRPQVSALIPHKTYLWGMDLSGSMQGAGGVGGLLKEGSLYPAYDANGNIVQKLNSSGVASMEVEYDPFGNIISGTLVGEYGFSTKPLIGSILMYYYGFRYYDPVTGRWPSRDPIEEDGGLNLYAMVGNDSINAWDYLGQHCCKVKSFEIKVQRWTGGWPSLFARTYTRRLKVRFKLVLEEGSDNTHCLIRQEKRGLVTWANSPFGNESFPNWTIDGPTNWWDGSSFGTIPGSWKNNGKTAIFRDEPGIRGASKDNFPIYYGGVGGSGHFEFKTYVLDRYGSGSIEDRTLAEIQWGLLIDYSSPSDGSHYFYL